MDFSSIKSSLNVLKKNGLESIEFCGGGEPLLHPGLLDFSQYLKQRDFALGLLTNGLDFNPDQAVHWVSAYSYIRISLDAATPETFCKVKGAPPDGFNKVLNNIIALIDAASSSDAACEVSIKVCLTPDNVMEIDQIIALAKKLKADSIAFKTARNWPMELSADSAEKAQKTIEACKVKSNDKSPKIFGGAAPSSIDGQCTLTPLNITIDSDGEIYLCHYFYHRKKSHGIGNIAKPMEKIWGSPRHRKAIKSIIPAQCNLYDCRFHTYNKIAKRVMVKGSLKFL